MNNKEIKWESYVFNTSKDVDGHDESSYLAAEANEMNHINQLPLLVNTAVGVFRMDDDLNPFKMYKFWIGHTNFTIDENVNDIIKRVDGIEVLHVMSRYRFLIAVGELFTFQKVRVDIEHQLCGKHNIEIALSEIANKELRDMVSSKIDALSKYKYWYIYVFPNGEMDTYHCDENTSYFYEKLEVCHQAQDISNGIFLHSENT